jgi:hypothetical protein
MKREDVVAEAERAVAAFEALPLGEAFREAYDNALRAVMALRREAFAALGFDRIEPAGADLIADFKLATDPVGGNLEAVMVGLQCVHQSALSTHPKLAAVIRGRAGFERIRQAARASAPLRGKDPELHTLAGERAFTEVLAQHLRAANLCAPAAEWMSVLIPALDQRAFAAAERHRLHAEAEASRIKREEDQASAALTDNRRNDLIDWFEKHRGVPFVESEVGGDLDGRSIANLLKQGDMTLDRAEGIRADHVENLKRKLTLAGE